MIINIVVKMKVHYINILLFALPLNILITLCYVNFLKNPYITSHTRTTRFLCECELYTSIYNNDPEMKYVMQDFDRKTSQRFEEYNERMIKNRQKCKEQCEKDIEKIILKDKIKQKLAEQFSALEKNIDINDIPTCVCERSLADKTEKFCLNCGYALGGGVLQSLGLFGGSGIYAWKIGATTAAIAAAKKAGAAAGKAAGDIAGTAKVVQLINSEFSVSTLGKQLLKSFFIETHYTDISKIIKAVHTQFDMNCLFDSAGADKPICSAVTKLSLVEGGGPGESLLAKDAITIGVQNIVSEAEGVAANVTKTATKNATSLAIKNNTAAVEGGFNSYITAINASIIAILIIVLVMIIIYLILRYRRKKKMKKKFQYIKLLKE
ncbi:rifin [Plasmodium sp. gorilla clade G1]|nr:rifin [Plasmodium sp. gorilla clade G1]